MYFQDFFDIFQIDEVIDDPVRITRQVDQRGIVIGRFVQPVNRHDGKQLIDREGIRR